MKKIIILPLVLLLISIFSIDAMAKEVPLVFMEKSDEAIELAIAKYMRKTKDWNVNIKYLSSNPEDAYLTAKFGVKRGNNKESLLLIVDTTVASRTKATGEPNLVRIKVVILPSNGGGRVKNTNSALRWINKWGQGKWAPGKVIVDKDGDLQCEDFILVDKNAPVHLGQVVRHIDFLLDSFADFMIDARADGIVQ
ncbi:hypothetical protein [Maridesulfovibrio sp.]|uniref:hypothetical protein n=1 Tax=Maridesulfovibrio sp. TaxID=2795000 RepID=UPI002A18E87D|nr:hypothetical protein [Maridesulfovibrio sp.]